MEGKKCLIIYNHPRSAHSINEHRLHLSFYFKLFLFLIFDSFLFLTCISYDLE